MGLLTCVVVSWLLALIGSVNQLVFAWGEQEGTHYYLLDYGVSIVAFVFLLCGTVLSFLAFGGLLVAMAMSDSREANGIDDDGRTLLKHYRLVGMTLLVPAVVHLIGAGIGVIYIVASLQATLREGAIIALASVPVNFFVAVGSLRVAAVEKARLNEEVEKV